MEYFNEEQLLKEVDFRFVRSGGKGGQNVNKVASKAELYFDINNSQLLLPEQKEILLNKLSTRLSENGVLKITSQDARTQLENKAKATRKFFFIIKKTLAPVKKRIVSKPTLQSKENRLQDKKLKSLIKKLRQQTKDY